MKIHVLQHVPFEGPANIARWGRNNGASISVTKFFEPSWRLPSPSGMDLLVVLGGPMGVHDEEANPWLVAEKKFIKECIHLNRKVLGVCLGAQLCAEALGANVYKNAQKEIGWFPLHRVATHHFLTDMPESMTAFHWHSDTFDLPEGSKHLAYSAACINQMYIWNEQVLGIQCHLEATKESIEDLIKYCGTDLAIRCDTVQQIDKLRQGFGNIDVMVPILDGILDQFMN